jgi:hypothetical protein
MPTLLFLGTRGGPLIASASYAYVVEPSHWKEQSQQPDDKDDNDNDVKNVLDLPVHRDVGIHDPQQHSDYRYDYD